MHESESEVTQSCPTLSDPMDCSLPGSSIHGIFQARALEWGAIAFTWVCNSDNVNTRTSLHVCREGFFFFFLIFFKVLTTHYIIWFLWELSTLGHYVSFSGPCANSPRRAIVSYRSNQSPDQAQWLLQLSAQKCLQKELTNEGMCESYFCLNNENTEICRKPYLLTFTVLCGGRVS